MPTFNVMSLSMTKHTKSKKNQKQPEQVSEPESDMGGVLQQPD